MKKLKAKRLSVKAEYVANIKFMGEEPQWPEGTILSKAEELKALNWYSTMMDAEDARGIIVDWMNANGFEANAMMLSQIDAMWIPKSVAWIIQISNRGGVFDRDMGEFIDIMINQAIAHWKPKEAKADKPTVRDHINDKLNDMIGDIETAIDQRDPKFSIPTFIKERNVAPALIQRMYDYYAPRYTEYLHTLADPDIPRRKDAKEHKMYLAKIVADLFSITAEQRNAPKAPRKKRKVNMDVKMRHFKPHPDTKVKPASVIGAQEVWLLNVKYNIVTVLYADGPNGLDIHRTAIVGFDKNTSMSKRCGRHVDNVVNVIHKGSKVARRKLINETIKTAAIDLKNRVTEEVIILFSSK